VNFNDLEDLELFEAINILMQYRKKILEEEREINFAIRKIREIMIKRNIA
jgi:DNA-binding MltR family transcriptional regulator